MQEKKNISVFLSYGNTLLNMLTVPSGKGNG